MKLYDSVGPNPRLVRMFLAEKALSLPSVQVDIMGGENRARRPTARRIPSASCRRSSSTTAA